jgi:hypothetical protein
MMKRLAPLLHKFKLAADVSPIAYPWGFVPQDTVTNILKLLVESPPSNIEFIEELKQLGRTNFNRLQFEEGVCQGYIAVLKHYQRGSDFLDVEYATPRLSCALNYLTAVREKHKVNVPEVDTSNMKASILQEWVEYGVAKSNRKFLGIWTGADIQSELMIGMSGPEFPAWYTKPMRQRVCVKYELLSEQHIEEGAEGKGSGRTDVWVWERRINYEEHLDERGNEEWTVCDINNILVK